MSDNANYAIEVAGANCRPFAELRQSILGEADLRGQWMAEYAIDIEESVKEVKELLPARKSGRREYGR